MNEWVPHEGSEEFVLEDPAVREDPDVWTDALVACEPQLHRLEKVAVGRLLRCAVVAGMEERLSRPQLK